MPSCWLRSLRKDESVSRDQTAMYGGDDENTADVESYPRHVPHHREFYPGHSILRNRTDAPHIPDTAEVAPQPLNNRVPDHRLGRANLGREILYDCSNTPNYGSDTDFTTTSSNCPLLEAEGHQHHVSHHRDANPGHGILRRRADISQCSGGTDAASPHSSHRDFLFPHSSHSSRPSVDPSIRVTPPSPPTAENCLRYTALANDDAHDRVSHLHHVRATGHPARTPAPPRTAASSMTYTLSPDHRVEGTVHDSHTTAAQRTMSPRDTAGAHSRSVIAGNVPMLPRASSSSSQRTSAKNQPVGSSSRTRRFIPSRPTSPPSVSSGYFPTLPPEMLPGTTSRTPSCNSSCSSLRSHPSRRSPGGSSGGPPRIPPRRAAGDSESEYSEGDNDQSQGHPACIPFHMIMPRVAFAGPQNVNLLPCVQTPSVACNSAMTGRGGWVPHPCPHPHIPPQVFWGSGPVVPRTLPATPFDSAAQALLSGGFPLPGRAPVGWMPGTWPPSSTFTPILSTRHIVLCPWLIPNPANPSMPHVRWDITQHPSTAKRITGRELVVDLKPKMNDQATYPPVQRAHIHCDLGVVSDLWGPIIVKNRDAVTVRDIVMAIYEYFQIRLSQDEVSYISALGSPQNYEKMVGSMYTRCMITPSLPGYEWSQGMRRVDCLGDSTKFWGLWVTENDDDTWQLNLGILPELRGVWV